jgi:hypothetical protein
MCYIAAGGGLTSSHGVPALRLLPPHRLSSRAALLPPHLDELGSQVLLASLPAGCSRQNFTVEAGKTYLFRIISATTLTYQTVCFGGHKVTVVAADAVPVEPLEVACVDVNSGQR